MTCEEFGACQQNDRTADKLGLQLDREDPRTAAEAIRQELWDRPPSVAVDLLDRIQHYDEPGVGADLKIEPITQEVRDGYGRSQMVHTGDKGVYVDSQYGREQVAILRGRANAGYEMGPGGYDYADRFSQRGMDPMSMIGELFVGQMMNGLFSRWQNQPHYRDSWQDRRGQMWYPEQNTGHWGPRYDRGGDWNNRRFMPRSGPQSLNDSRFWQGEDHRRPHYSYDYGRPRDSRPGWNPGHEQPRPWLNPNHFQHPNPGAEQPRRYHPPQGELPRGTHPPFYDRPRGTDSLPPGQRDYQRWQREMPRQDRDFQRGQREIPRSGADFQRGQREIPRPGADFQRGQREIPRSGADFQRGPQREFPRPQQRDGQRSPHREIPNLHQQQQQHQQLRGDNRRGR